jgi:hypothetical protein
LTKVITPIKLARIELKVVPKWASINRRETPLQIEKPIGK